MLIATLYPIIKLYCLVQINCCLRSVGVATFLKSLTRSNIITLFCYHYRPTGFPQDWYPLFTVLHPSIISNPHLLSQPSSRNISRPGPISFMNQCTVQRPKIVEAGSYPKAIETCIPNSDNWQLVCSLNNFLYRYLLFTFDSVFSFIFFPEFFSQCCPFENMFDLDSYSKLHSSF